MSRSAPLRSLGAMYRFPALAVAVIWCAAPVLAILHAHTGTEVHRYCAEHGALEDVAEGATQAPAPEGSGATVGGSETEAAHAGCAFARFCRFGGTLGPFVPETRGVVEREPIPAPADRVAPAAIPVFVVAPKTSPPV